MDTICYYPGIITEKYEEDRKKVVEYICDKLNIDYKFNNEDHLKIMSDFINGVANTYKNELLQITIDGINDYDLAQSQKNNLPLMLKLCEMHIENMIKNGVQPAPYYFERVAILARKEKNYKLEIEICELYIKYIDLFLEANEKNNTLLHLDIIKGNINIKEGRYKKILTRLSKAKLLLEKSINKLV